MWLMRANARLLANERTRERERDRESESTAYLYHIRAAHTKINDFVTAVTRRDDDGTTRRRPVATRQRWRRRTSAVRCAYDCPGNATTVNMQCIFHAQDSMVNYAVLVANAHKMANVDGFSQGDRNVWLRYWRRSCSFFSTVVRAFHSTEFL